MAHGAMTSSNGILVVITAKVKGNLVTLCLTRGQSRGELPFLSTPRRAKCSRAEPGGATFFFDSAPRKVLVRVGFPTALVTEPFSSALW
jgi:hypothetical protein